MASSNKVCRPANVLYQDMVAPYNSRCYTGIPHHTKRGTGQVNVDASTWGIPQQTGVVWRRQAATAPQPAPQREGFRVGPGAEAAYPTPRLTVMGTGYPGSGGMITKRNYALFAGVKDAYPGHSLAESMGMEYQDDMEFDQMETDRILTEFTLKMPATRHVRGDKTSHLDRVSGMLSYNPRHYNYPAQTQGCEDGNCTGAVCRTEGMCGALDVTTRPTTHHKVHIDRFRSILKVNQGNMRGKYNPKTHVYRTLN